MVKGEYQSSVRNWEVGVWKSGLSRKVMAYKMGWEHRKLCVFVSRYGTKGKSWETSKIYQLIKELFKYIVSSNENLLKLKLREFGHKGMEVKELRNDAGHGWKIIKMDQVKGDEGNVCLIEVVGVFRGLLMEFLGDLR